MASLNPLTREVVFKIVFYGPGLGGKTTTLQHIHAASHPDHRGKLVSLATPMDRTLYFDFLPLRMPLLHGMHVRLQLFTVPGQVYYGATRKLVLTGADGIVFVADSQAARHDANLESLEDLSTNLGEHGRALASMPHTFHWNKRDIPDVLPVVHLERDLNLFKAPSSETVATRGDGVFAGLERITELVFAAYEAEVPRSDADAVPDRQPVEEATIADALRGLAEAPRRGGTPSEGLQARPPASSGTPSSLESIPNPIPRRPSWTNEAGGGGQRSNSPSSNRSVTPSPAAAEPQVRAVTPPPSRGAQAALAQPAPAPPQITPAQNAPSPSNGGVPPTARPSGMQPAASLRGERDPGTNSPPSPSRSEAASFSLAALWPESDRDTVRQLEAAAGGGDAAASVLIADVLVSRLLASAVGGSADAPRDPLVVVTLLGVDGKRYLTFRATVRAARARQPVTLGQALEAYTFALEVRRVQASLPV